jgi:hypothetical protein
MIFRAVVAIGILLASISVFDEKLSTLQRFGAGGFIPVGAFLFYAVGQPGRLYAAAIGLFCAMLAGFGGVGCFLDSSCVSRDRAWWMIAATITFLCALWAFNSYPRHSVLRVLSQAIAITSATGLLYLAWYSRAFGGMLLFALIALVAFLAVFSPTQQTAVLTASIPRDGLPPSRPTFLVAVGASAMYWFAYMARDHGGWIVLIFGSLWLVGALTDAWKNRKTANADIAH